VLGFRLRSYQHSLRSGELPSEGLGQRA
jgi:hypothetical protein